jgi:hypothetical protein
MGGADSGTGTWGAAYPVADGRSSAGLGGDGSYSSGDE